MVGPPSRQGRWPHLVSLQARFSMCSQLPRHASYVLPPFNQVCVRHDHMAGEVELILHRGESHRQAVTSDWGWTGPFGYTLEQDTVYETTLFVHWMTGNPGQCPRGGTPMAVLCAHPGLCLEALSGTQGGIQAQPGGHAESGGGCRWGRQSSWNFWRQVKQAKEQWPRSRAPR